MSPSRLGAFISGSSALPASDSPCSYCKLCSFRGRFLGLRLTLAKFWPGGRGNFCLPEALLKQPSSEGRLGLYSNAELGRAGSLEQEVGGCRVLAQSHGERSGCQALAGAVGASFL